MKQWMVAVFAALILSTSLGVRAEDSPVEVVTSAADLLAAALAERREELESDSAALYALIDEIISSRFDRRYSAQLVLGPHWRKANEQQRNDFIDAFYNTLLRRYADGVLQFDEERMTVLPYKGANGKKRTVVKTKVFLDNGSEVPVNYGLALRKDGWKLYDVKIEGISYVRNFRTEMNAEISAKGLDAVIKRLQNPAAKK